MGKVGTFFRLLIQDRPRLACAIAHSLENSRLSHILPDKAYIRLIYRLRMGERLELENPRTFNAKLQWLKLYNRRPEYTELVDKVQVKALVARQLGKEYVIPTLGVWERAEDIDFQSLPERFVLKCSHDSGSVIICRDKQAFDFEAAKKKLAGKLKRNMFWFGREWPYKNVQPRILAEEYVEPSREGAGLVDYKFFCFNGTPRFAYVSQGLENHSTARISYVTLDWEQAAFGRSDFKEFEQLPDRPVNFRKMLEISQWFARENPFIRVDFYESGKKLYFGEITFFPGGGLTRLTPQGWDEKIGSWLTLPEQKNP